MSPYLPVLLIIALATLQRTMYVALLERAFNLTFKNAPMRSFLFFLLWCLAYILLFPTEIEWLFESVSLVGYLALTFVVIILFPMIFRALHESAGPPTWLEVLYPSQSMLALEEQYILSKVGDVLSQQLAGGILMALLAGLGFSYTAIVLFFVVLFALSHLYLFRTSGLIWGLHYTAFSAAAGFAVPFLIFHVPGGIIYAIIGHLSFYVLSAAFFAEFPRPSRAVCIDILHDHEERAKSLSKKKR